MFSKIKKPNAFLMVAGCVFFSLALLLNFMNIDIGDNLILSAYIQVPYFFRLVASPFLVPFFLMAIIFTPHLTKEKLSKASKWAGIPLVLLSVCTFFVYAISYSIGFIKYTAVQDVRYEMQQATVSQINEVYENGGCAVVYVTSPKYPDIEVAACINQITRTYPVYILHYEREASGEEFFETWGLDKNIQEPFVVTIFHGGYAQQVFFAQEIIDGNLEAHLNLWASEKFYFIKELTQIGNQ